MSFHLHEQVDCPIGSPFVMMDKFGFSMPTVNGWFTCRETATNKLWSVVGRLRKEIYYGFLNTEFGNWDYYSCKWHIVRMFDYVENRMGWWDRTRVHDTPYNNIVKVYLSGGWLQNHNAASLALLFLRLGPRFNSDMNFDHLLNLNSYSRCTMNAIYRFLDGHQHFRGESNGWVNNFNHATVEQVNNLLISSSRVADESRRIRLNHISDESAWLQACHNLRLVA